MIRFDHVSKRFDDGTVAVDNFELTVESHHLVVLLGSSGCGKTTLLRMVNRMVDPSEGRILIDDTDVATVNPVKLRRQIGYVMQSGGLLPHRTVVDNIAAVPLLLAGQLGRFSAWPSCLRDWQSIASLPPTSCCSTSCSRPPSSRCTSSLQDGAVHDEAEQR